MRQTADAWVFWAGGLSAVLGGVYVYYYYLYRKEHMEKKWARMVQEAQEKRAAAGGKGA